ncbi:MAG: hypothetical protein ACRDKV_09220 [Solirubrobacterales bacterium]
MRRASVSIAVAAVCAAVVSGCGDDDEDPQVDAVAETYTTYIEAVKDGDGEAACRLLAPELRRTVADSIALGTREELKGATCEQAVSQGTLPQLQQVEPNLEQIEDDGRRASGLDPGEGPIGPQEVFFERIGGDWKISRTVFFRQ